MGKAGTIVREQIRRDILSGAWTPGGRLQPAVLAPAYSTSTTVVREALTRLSGEGIITIEPNRGFFLPHLSLDQLRDLTEVRCRSEALALELAFERADLGWETTLIGAHHLLARTPRRSATDPNRVDEAWAEAHRAFHRALIEACGVPLLLNLSRQLADATELYRRWAAPSQAAVSRDVEREHVDLLDAALSRDAEQAGELLRRHYERTVEVVLQSGLLRESTACTRPSGLT
ncbi:DNA-binding GntR family transcriptional regulator [Arthrobacter sp. GAS37]|uniref:GntR family transcriptional regulator n=1 Tax=Arthrobacter sp. GAS37 TaxID=3156261 RepID=UPI003838B945